MLGLLKKHTRPIKDDSTLLDVRGSDEATEPLFDVELLDAQRTYRQEDRKSDFLRLVYSIADGARELIVVVPWESISILRAELARNRYDLSDEDILGLIVVPWALDRAASGSLSSGDVLPLEFDGGPRPPAAREMLELYGFPSNELTPSGQVDRSWVWEG